MPIKWDAVTDQVLLLKILETSSVTPKTDAISAAWPPNMVQPTPRAISERLVKIRNIIKANGGNAEFSVPNSRTATPAKRAPRGSKTPTSNNKKAGAKGNSGKRKRVKPEEGDTSESLESISKFIHDDDEDESSSTEIESPTKKAKTARVKREENTTPGLSVARGPMNGSRSKVAVAGVENGI